VEHGAVHRVEAHAVAARARGRERELGGAREELVDDARASARARAGGGGGGGGEDGTGKLDTD
jgi:hypothetical protein